MTWMSCTTFSLISRSPDSKYHTCGTIVCRMHYCQFLSFSFSRLGLFLLLVLLFVSFFHVIYLQEKKLLCSRALRAASRRSPSSQAGSSQMQGHLSSEVYQRSLVLANAAAPKDTRRLALRLSTDAAGVVTATRRQGAIGVPCVDCSMFFGRLAETDEFLKR